MVLPPQPNVTGRGILAGYTPRFWLIVVLLGLTTGAAGSILMELLRLVDRAAWNCHPPSFHQAVTATPAWRHVATLAGAAGVTDRLGGADGPETWIIFIRIVELQRSAP